MKQYLCVEEEEDLQQLVDADSKAITGVKRFVLHKSLL